MPSDAARPDPSCPTCEGTGFIVYRQGELARARVCDCIPDCPRCHGSGRVALQRDGTTVVGRCVCQKIPDRVALFEHAGIPGRYADATIVSFSKGANKYGDPQKFAALTGISAWLGRFDAHRENRGLVLHGAVGRGKTHLLIGVLRNLVFGHGVPVRFIEFSRLLAQLRETYEKRSGSIALLNDLATVPVLAIDELGKGRMTPWELSIIDEVISRRYNAMACTLGTSNYHPAPATGALPPNLASAQAQTQTLGDRVGERVYSRLREMCDLVEVAGLDFREISRQ